MASKSTMQSRKDMHSYKTLTLTSSPVTFSAFTGSVGKTIAGSSLKNYKEIIKNGASATTPYSKQEYIARIKYRRVVMLVTDGLQKGAIGYDTSGGLRLQQFTVPSFVATSTKAANDANIGIRQKIRRIQASWAGPTFVGEFHKTVQGIRHPAQLLRQRTGLFIDRALKDRQGRPYSKMTPSMKSALGQLWLEWSFGVKPLIADISDIADASLDFEGRVETTRVRYAASSSSGSSSGLTAACAGIEAYITVHQDDLIRSDHKYVCGVNRRITADYGTFHRIVALGGFDLSSFLPTAYELMPWSWLIDYFTNIGQVLSAATTSFSDVIWWSNTSCDTATRVHRVTDVRGGSPSVLSLTSPGRSHGYVSYKTITRSATAPGFPGVTFCLPGRSAQFLNLAGLLASRDSWRYMRR